MTANNSKGDEFEMDGNPQSQVSEAKKPGQSRKRAAGRRSTYRSGNARTGKDRNGSDGSPAQRYEVIAVVIKQYGTGLYRTCVSLDPENVTFLSTHQDERSANETISLFWRAYDEGQLRTPEDISRFISTIEPPRAKSPGSPAGVTPEVEQVFTPLAA